MVMSVRSLAALAAVCLFALPAAAGSVCRGLTPHEGWKDAETVWWGHQQVAHAAYMPFETQKIPEPADLDPEFGIVYFDLDKYAIRDSELPTLNTLAAWLRDNPRETITLEGHCCDLASDAYNMRLGQNRANAVKAWLVRNGIAEERISTESYGKRRLVSPPPARHLNRRVVTLIDES